MTVALMGFSVVDKAAGGVRRGENPEVFDVFSIVFRCLCNVFSMVFQCFNVFFNGFQMFMQCFFNGFSIFQCFFNGF